jgi:hypothetical protein
MNKSVINQIKVLLGMELKFETMKLENGTTLEAESFEIGWDIFVVSEDGEKIAAPDGEYALEDARVIVVKDGAIMSIGEAEAEEVEQVVEEEMKVETEAPAKKVVESVTKETHFSAEQITELETMLTLMFERHLVSINGDDKETKEQVDLNAQDVVEEVKVEPKKKSTKKEKMSEEIKHNPEKNVKSFKSNKRNVGQSTRQTILSKMSKINK